jgi:uncharacterized repeat protein (TIGR01451 family)
MDTQTKRVKWAIRLGWVGVLLFWQVGLGPMAGATPVASESVAPPGVPLTSSVAEYDIHKAGGPIEASGPQAAAAEVSWPMAAANPERTSWTAEQVPSAAYLAAHRKEFGNGVLYPQWYKPFEPYISHKVQIIAANDTLYISTAKGLYALNATDGSQKWVYPTELPLGHSPTISNGVAYVGGFDKKMYAIDAFTGSGLWTFEAGAGFETNPLVVNGKLYAGNRDGYFYALYVQGSNMGKLAWKYQTDGPILFSAAYKDGVVFFASNDSYAYALNAESGAFVWKSKLPGAGFHSWWPVVYQNSVVFAGSSNYRDNVQPCSSPCVNIDQLDREVFPNGQTDPRGTPVGPRGSDGWIDASRITQYFEAKPWRRTFFVLNRANGQEVTYDFDGDEKKEYAPMLWLGTQSGNRYPPVVGSDGIIYQSNNFMSNEWINGGGVSGWKIGTPFISTPSAHWIAIDEPIAYSAGGNIIYWVYHDDLSAGAFDLSVPNTRFWDHGHPNIDSTREWNFWDYNLSTLLPGYGAASGGWEFGGRNGVYGRNGDQNPLIPYKGKIYVHRGNAVIALGQGQVTPVHLPTAATVTAPPATVAVSYDQLQQRLAEQVQKMLAAGHLRPGYKSSGHIDGEAVHNCGDNFQDYWHDPSETLSVLLRALPYLPSTLQASTKSYLQSEFATYRPYLYSHIGWAKGAARDAFDLPPEVEAGRASFPATQYAGYDFEGWGERYGGTNIPPHTFYALWKYAQVFGGAKAIFDSSKSELMAVPSSDILTKYPFVHNSLIAGYWGYLELQKLAGYSESSNIRSQLNTLLASRASGFSKDTPYTDSGDYCRAYSTSRNFMFMVPELADYLRKNALGKVQAALDEYTRVEPYWFAAAFEDAIGEAVIQPLYDYHALFQARALVLKESPTELAKYLDVPAMSVGDLYYIDNLVTLLESQGIPVAQAQVTKSASKLTARQGDVITYTLMASNLCSATVTTTVPVTVTDRLPTGMNLNTSSCKSSATPLLPTCSGSNVTWKGNLSPTGTVVISYTAQIITTTPTSLVNQMRVKAGTCGVDDTASVTIFANPMQVYLPLILKGAG